MIKNIIYQYLRDKKEADNKIERNPEYQYHWSPSYYTRCLRQTFYKKIGAPISNEISIHSLLKMEAGTGIHHQLKELYRRIARFYNDDRFQYIEAEKEYITKDWSGITFIYQPDDVISVNGTVFLIENKTKYGQGIEVVKRIGIEKDYEIQLLLYMVLENIEQGEFFFLATDSAYCEDFAYTATALKEKYRDYIRERNEKIRQVILDVKLYFTTGEKKIPDREGQVNLKKTGDGLKCDFQKDNKKYKSFPCAWGENRCSYFNMCWREVLDKMRENSYYVDGQFIK